MARWSGSGSWDKIVRESDLFRQVPRLEMPAYFLVGRHDMVGTHLLVRRYFDMLEAPRGKTFITFDHSGHWPHLDESGRFRVILAGSIHDAYVAGMLPERWPQAA